MRHERRGDVSLKLTSPSGTVSNILSFRHLDNSSNGIRFTFMTVHHWGENPAGTWSLRVEDSLRDGTRGQRGQLRSWSLTLNGVAGDRPNHRGTGISGNEIQRGEENADSSEQARPVGTSEVKELMEQEAESSNAVQIQSLKKRNELRRKWLLERGFSPDDVDFLISLFEAEQEEYRQKSAEDNSAKQTRSEIPDRRGKQRPGGRLESQNSPWRKTYDTSRRSYWNPSKRNLESIETDRQRIVDQGASEDDSLRALLDALTAVLEDE